MPFRKISAIAFRSRSSTVTWSSALHVFLILLLALLLAGLQTSFWFHLFGAVTPPLLWLVVITYVAAYRDGMSAIYQLVFLALLLSAFTATSLKVFYLSLLIYCVFIHFFKSRIFWSGSGYFLMLCTMGSVAFHFIFYLLAVIVDKGRADLILIERVTQILLTPAFCLPIYWVLNFIDGLFHRREIKTETGSVTYD